MPIIKITQLVEQEVETEVNDAVYIGHKIAHYRKQKNLKQFELAKLLNATDTGYLCQVEKGKKNISIKKLKEICSLLGLASNKILPF